MSTLPIPVDDDGIGSTLALNDDAKNSGMGLFSVEGETSTTSFKDEYDQLFSLNNDQSSDDSSFDSLDVLPDTQIEKRASLSFSDESGPRSDAIA